ncbi:MAG: prepilin peptidase [Defluviitaleaceae bacterium]|nr:prepilin peptidase [Defluviitaleaceae bacterium]
MPQFIINLYAAIFGLCFGSFANVAVYRLPLGKSIVKPPSHCPSCGKRLAAADLIPVLSWLLLRGRCRYCKKRIGVRYPLIEVACSVLFACMANFTGSNLSAVPLCMLAFVLLCVTVIDGETQTIPNGLLLFGGAVGIIWTVSAFFFPETFIHAVAWHDALLGVAAGALPLIVIDRVVHFFLKKDGFGFGDVKLMAMAGLFLGWQLIFVSFFFAFVSGGVYGAYLIMFKQAKKGSYIAFGPFLCAGILTALWFGKSFIGWMLP